jgi:hypothetical protein
MKEWMKYAIISHKDSAEAQDFPLSHLTVSYSQRFLALYRKDTYF